MNAGAKLYRSFNNKHLEPVAGEIIGDEGMILQVRTCQSNIHVAQAVRTQAYLGGQLLTVPRLTIEEPGYVGQEMEIDVKEGETLTLEKLATLYTSRDHAISECGLEARKAKERARKAAAAAAKNAK